MGTDFPRPKETYEVVCECMTYNQSKFIEDTMNGFVMQKTDFPFVCVIIDDASTDGEQDVIKSYLDKCFDMQNAETYDIETSSIIVARHLANTNCTFAIYFLKKNLWSQPKLKSEHINPWMDQCKYVAYCEGDDYWTDSRKLQMQYDLLEQAPNISLCFHSVRVLNIIDNTMKDDYLTRDVSGESTINDLIEGNYIHTPSVMFRYDRIYSQKINSMGLTYVSDYPMWMLCAQQGNLYKIKESMAVYRYGSGFWSAQSHSYIYPRWVVMLSKLYPFMDENVRPAIDIAIDNAVVSIHDNFIKEFNEINGIKSSYSYRIGYMILRPIKFITRLAKRKRG